jgi:nucleotide-binding universal stress UspA family protein
MLVEPAARARTVQIGGIIMYRRILIPLDGSKTAEKVLPYGRWLSSKLNVPVELMCVIDFAEMSLYSRRDDDSGDILPLLEDALKETVNS